MGVGEEIEPSKKSLSRRSHLEIRMDMLNALMEGAEGPTQIMYRANLSWMLLCEHLKTLLSLGFVDEITTGNRKKYTLTEKGMTIVRSYLSVIRAVELDPDARVRAASAF